jgi:DNA-directed RNA polymerase subunit RPC12/RpoP
MAGFGGDGNSQQIGSMPNINVFGYPSVKCEECGSEVFIPGVIFKKIPGFLVGGGSDEISIPVKVAVCSKCGNISPEDKKIIKQQEENFKKAEAAKSKSGLII